MSRNPTVKHDYCSSEESWVLSVTNRCYIILDCTSCRSVLTREQSCRRSPVTNISTLFTETQKKNTKERKTENIGNIYSMNTISWWCSRFLAKFFTTSCVRCWHNKSIKATFYLFYDWNSKNTQVEKQPPRHVTRCCHKTSAWRRKHLYIITFLKPLSHLTRPIRFTQVSGESS